MSTRRGFIGGLVAVAGALVVPGEEQVRRFWCLDSSMVAADKHVPGEPVRWREVDPLTVVPEYGPDGLEAVYPRFAPIAHPDIIKEHNLGYPYTMRPFAFTAGSRGAIKATLDAPVRVVLDNGVWRIADTQRDGVAGAERP